MSEVTLPKIISNIEECLRLCKDSFEGKRLEFCVNRGYYAMFHSIKALLFTQDINSKTHAGVHSQFDAFYIKTDLFCISLNNKLQRSFVKKQFADYSYDEVTEDQANESLEDAAQFVHAVMCYLKENNHLK